MFFHFKLEGIIGKVLDDIAVTRGTSILALPVPVMSKILSYRPGQQWPLFWYRTVCRFFRDAIDEELKVPYTRTLPLHYSEKRNKWRINDKKLQKMDTAMATFFLRINSHSFLQMTVTKRHTHALPKVVDFELVVSDTKTVSTSKLLSTSEIVGLATGKPHLFSLVEYMPPLKNMLLTVTIRSPSHP
ncbi:hypothetical protein Pelo_19598 [Pelomyxa schiedti]|nr:hypothetical protein Pelo_19598 [Pelomyxa schiedti]